MIESACARTHTHTHTLTLTHTHSHTLHLQVPGKRLRLEFTSPFWCCGLGLGVCQEGPSPCAVEAWLTLTRPGTEDFAAHELEQVKRACGPRSPGRHRAASQRVTNVLLCVGLRVPLG